MDALLAARRVRRRPRGADHHARRRLLRVGRAWEALPRQLVGTVHGPGRTRSCRAGRRRSTPGRDARVLPDLDVRAPAGHRARRAPRRARARRPQPRVLHQRRVGGRRVGVEAGAPVLQGHRAAPAVQGDRAPHRVPRHHARRALHHGRAGVAGAVRAARAGRQPRPQHAPLSASVRRRRRGVPGGRHRPDRGADHRGGTRDGGRGVPRARAERGWMLDAARRLLRARARSAIATACCSCPTR